MPTGVRTYMTGALANHSQRRARSCHTKNYGASGSVLEDSILVYYFPTPPLPLPPSLSSSLRSHSLSLHI